MKFDDFTQDGVLLKDIVWEEGKRIIESPFHQSGNQTRLYYQIPDYDGFNFCVVEFRSAAGSIEDVWDDPEIEVEVICSGIAFFDGIRHLWMPYWHYPDMDDALELFRFLGELVKKHCPDP